MFGVKLFFFLFFTAFAVCMFSTMFATPVFMIGLGIYSLGAGTFEVRILLWICDYEY